MSVPGLVVFFWFRFKKQNEVKKKMKKENHKKNQVMKNENKMNKIKSEKIKTKVTKENKTKSKIKKINHLSVLSQRRGQYNIVNRHLLFSYYLAIYETFLVWLSCVMIVITARKFSPHAYDVVSSA